MRKPIGVTVPYRLLEKKEKRKWVGLTDWEVKAYYEWADFQIGCGRQTLFDMVRDIEAKLRSKNNG